MINCIVVDDEPLARQLIAQYIEQVPGMQCIGEHANAMEAFAALHANNVDAIFIDIEMPGINGLNFIRSLKNVPKVVFITAYADYAVEAFEIEAVDYLLKPVTPERFLKAVRKLAPSNNQNVTIQPASDITSIFVKIDKRLINIDLDQIVYIEGLGDYLKVHCVGQTYVVYMPMGKMEELLPKSRFIRIHRSTIINRQCIRFIEGNFVRINDTDLTIGLTYREHLLNSVNNVK